MEKYSHQITKNFIQENFFFFSTPFSRIGDYKNVPKCRIFGRQMIHDRNLYLQSERVPLRMSCIIQHYKVYLTDPLIRQKFSSQKRIISILRDKVIKNGFLKKCAVCMKDDNAFFLIYLKKESTPVVSMAVHSMAPNV